jgi:hypothetical protein
MLFALRSSRRTRRPRNPRFAPEVLERRLSPVATEVPLPPAEISPVLVPDPEPEPEPPPPIPDDPSLPPIPDPLPPIGPIVPY